MPNLEALQLKTVADLLATPEEWQAAYILSKKRPPKQAPSLNTFIRLIAGLGGSGGPDPP